MFKMVLKFLDVPEASVNRVDDFSILTRFILGMYLMFGVFIIIVLNEYENIRNFIIEKYHQFFKSASK